MKELPRNPIVAILISLSGPRLGFFFLVFEASYSFIYCSHDTLKFKQIKEKDYITNTGRATYTKLHKLAQGMIASFMKSSRNSF